jgi:hypothetical protein
MLISEATKHAAGIKIYGDYLDLNSLHQTIHYLVEGVPLDGGKSVLGEFVLGLAYEVRHAFQQDRETRKFGHDEYDTVTYRGFQYLWPYILPQVGLLRWAASFHPTNRSHQSNLFRIEECIQSALFSIDSVVGNEVFDWLSHFSGWSDNYYTQFIDNCALWYVTRATTKKARFKMLPEVLHMMAPWGERYRKFAEQIESIAKEKNCSPHQLTDLKEWPEFKW